ncbi:unnamed protein product [Gordionus sp. m RMFG-2023]
MNLTLLNKSKNQHDDEPNSKTADKSSLTPFLMWTVMVIVMSSYQYGYAIGVVNPPEKILRSWYNETHYEKTGKPLTKVNIVLLWGFTVGIFCIGGMFGGLIGGTLTQRYGRRGCLLLNNLLAISGAVLMGSAKPAKSYYMIILGRLLIGFNAGVSSVAVPIYLADVSPVNLRGAIGSVNQLGIVVSLLVAQFLGLPQFLGNDKGWPIMFSLSIAPALLQTGLLFLVPESPPYLLAKRDLKDARSALYKLRPQNGAQVEKELELMKQESENEKKIVNTSWKDMIMFPVYRRALAVAIRCHMAQQLSGINAVMFFSTSIFMKAGLSASNAVYATCGIEKAGRRILFLIGLGGMWICTILLTVFLLLGQTYPWCAYISILLVMAFVTFCAIGPNAIAWFISVELFPPGPRPKAMSLSVIFNWFSTFLVGSLFPLLFVGLGDYVFLIFTALLAIFWLFTYLYLPETKNKMADEMIQYFMTDEEKKSAFVMNKVFGKTPEEVKLDNEERRNLSKKDDMKNKTKILVDGSNDFKDSPDNI